MPSMKKIAFVDVIIFTISYELCFTFVVFDCMIMVALPIMIRTMAVRSYFQTNVSLRHVIDRIVLTMKAVAEFAVNRVRSANGNTPEMKRQ